MYEPKRQLSITNPQLLEILQICSLFGKGLKQIPTTVLLGLLSLISFSMGHGAVDVVQFWSEAIIFWLVIVLPTGWCMPYCISCA